MSGHTLRQLYSSSRTYSDHLPASRTLTPLWAYVLAAGIPQVVYIIIIYIVYVPHPHYIIVKTVQKKIESCGPLNS